LADDASSNVATCWIGWSAIATNRERNCRVKSLSEPRVMTSPNHGSSPEQVCGALATIYRRAIERYEETKVTDEDGGEDAKKETNNDEFCATPATPH
jgi:hypothetical protein